MDVTMRTATTAGLARGACLAIFLAALLAGRAWSANAPVYKCLGTNLEVLYTDVPCKDAEPMDVRAGDADPAAVARLERERDALDQSFAQRLADGRRDRVPLANAMGFPYEPPRDGDADDDSPIYLYGYGLASSPLLRHPRRPRHPGSPHPEQHFASNPPFAAPRR